MFDNINEFVKDDLKQEIRSGSKVSIAAACFSIYAYQELKEQDEVCDNFIRQIHGDLPTENPGDLKTDLADAREREKLQKRIAQLENKLRREKQFKKQMEIRAEIKRLVDSGQ